MRGAIQAVVLFLVFVSYIAYLQVHLVTASHEFHHQHSHAQHNHPHEGSDHGHADSHHSHEEESAGHHHAQDHDLKLSKSRDGFLFTVLAPVFNSLILDPPSHEAISVATFKYLVPPGTGPPQVAHSRGPPSSLTLLA